MNDGLDGLDALRVFVVSMAGLTIGLAAYIAVTYVRTYVDLGHAGHARRWAPLHVAGFAVAHCMYALYGAGVLVERIGTPLTWGTPYLVAANLLSAVVLLVAARREHARIVAARRADELGHPLRRRDDL